MRWAVSVTNFDHRWNGWCRVMHGIAGHSTMVIRCSKAAPVTRASRSVTLWSITPSFTSPAIPPSVSTRAATVLGSFAEEEEEKPEEKEDSADGDSGDGASR